MRKSGRAAWLHHAALRSSRPDPRPLAPDPSLDLERVHVLDRVEVDPAVESRVGEAGALEEAAELRGRAVDPAVLVSLHRVLLRVGLDERHAAEQAGDL